MRLLVAERDEGKVAERFKREPQPELALGSDPRSLNEYLFLRVGELSLREFAGDSEIRSVVNRAVSKIDDFLESPDQDPHRGGGSSVPTHLRAAEDALERGDAVGALARLRLWVELELQQLALLFEVPLTDAGGPSRLIRSLMQIGAITPSEARILSGAVRLANGAVHGEAVETTQAAQVLRSTANVMWDIAERVRASRPVSGSS
jgi:hypothetical protein